MRDIGISEFKASCFSLIRQVSKTQQPLSITRHGRLIAKVVPSRRSRKPFVLGDMVGTAVILGDIVSPIIEVDETPRSAS